MSVKTAPPSPIAAPRVLTDRWGQLFDQPIVAAESLEWRGVRLTTLHETDGDVVVPALERDTLVMTMEGSPRNYAKIGSREFSTPARAGQVATLPRGIRVASNWQNHGPVQTFQMLEFTPEVFGIYMPENVTDTMVAGHLAPQGFADRPTLASLIKLLAQEHRATERRGKLFAETLIRLLVIEIAGSAWTRAAGNDSAAPVGDRRIRRALDFIEAHFREDLSITDIAGAAGLSPSQLTAAFQRALGQSPYSYVISRRLQRATELLRQSGLSIAHVALEAGFCDQAHLTRLCRARLGKTPRQIRQG